MSRYSSLLLVLLALCCFSCVPVRPLDDLRSTVEAGWLMQIGSRQVHVERMGRGEPVIFVHGFGASTYSWRKVLPELSRRFSVIAVDLNGFGLTDRSDDPEAYTREGQIRLILDLMDTLGIESAHFVGHSYGGALTMNLVASHPGRVRSMVLVDSAPPDYPLDRRKWLARIRPATWMYLRGVGLRRSNIKRVFRRAYGDDTLVTDELIDAYLDRMRVEGTATAYRHMTRPRPSAERDTIDYAKLNVPALVVWGAEDRVVSEDTGRYYASMLPDYRFVTIEGAGHSPMEERPAEFVEHVAGFLDEVSSH